MEFKDKIAEVTGGAQGKSLCIDGGMARNRQMGKLVFIDACIRQGESRTRRIAYPILSVLSQRYEIVRMWAAAAEHWPTPWPGGTRRAR